MKKFFKVLAIILGSIAAAVLLLAFAVILKAKLSYENLERVDENGAFYSIDYVGNYESPLVSKALNLFSGGCSAFITTNENGEVITCRNYDFPHEDAEGNPSGLNVLVKCSPKGKYKSIGVADIGLFSVVGLPYYAGVLDEGGSSKIPLMYAPYLCMDGMNEMGVSVSILALDIKDGETAMHQTAEGKNNLMVNAVLRQILDNCASLDEAVELVENANVMCTFGCDYHLFVTDADGNSAVFEWRYNNFTVTYTNAVTNFYVGYDDGCDCYYGERLKESFTTAENVTKEYHYGYGHGYGRFAELAETLEEHSCEETDTGTLMTDGEAMALLQTVSQAYDPEAMTSLTQYSVIYNNSNKTVKVCVMRDYEDVYEFSVY